jgi:hypothetical protein
MSPRRKAFPLLFAVVAVLAVVTVGWLGGFGSLSLPSPRLRSRELVARGTVRAPKCGRSIPQAPRGVRPTRRGG